MVRKGSLKDGGPFAAGHNYSNRQEVSDCVIANEDARHVHMAGVTRP